MEMQERSFDGVHWAMFKFWECSPALAGEQEESNGRRLTGGSGYSHRIPSKFKQMDRLPGYELHFPSHLDPGEWSSLSGNSLWGRTAIPRCTILRVLLTASGIGSLASYLSSTCETISLQSLHYCRFSVLQNPTLMVQYTYLYVSWGGSAGCWDH